MSFMVLSRFHTLNLEFCRLIMAGTGRFNVSSSQYFLTKHISSNMSPFKYFKNVSTGMHQSFNFLTYLYFLMLKKIIQLAT